MNNDINEKRSYFLNEVGYSEQNLEKLTWISVVININAPCDGDTETLSSSFGHVTC